MPDLSRRGGSRTVPGFPSSGGPLLQVQDVSKSYGGRPVVDHVTFDVQAGEVFALLGPNGAGKTTLLRMITDILRPDSGSIRLDGQAIGSGIQRSFAYLPEERGLYRRSRVLEVLAYYGRLRGLGSRAALDASRVLLERVELQDWGMKQIQALSKGMQQKLQLCTTLIADPRVLILDEPFSGLDPINVQLFEEILHERRKAGATVVLSTHQMSKVEEVCDRALMINRGRMVLYGTVRDIRRKYADHAVVVRTDDAVTGLPGVRAVEPMNGETKLVLEASATPDSVLRALVDRNVRLESFAIASLPLEDIFVKVVREGLGLDRGESGEPTVDQLAGSAR